MSAGNDTRRGIWLMTATTFVFAMQDAFRATWPANTTS
jgi:hypothetical protein